MAAFWCRHCLPWARCSPQRFWCNIVEKAGSQV